MREWGRTLHAGVLFFSFLCPLWPCAANKPNPFEKTRPHHRLEGRVRSHIFLCMLAYYVEWNMREAWRPLMFTDQDQQAKQTRDPVAPAKRSAAALAKVAARTLDDGTPVHCFRTLLTELGTIVRNTCHAPGTTRSGPTFEVVTTANPTQARALELLKTIAV